MSDLTPAAPADDDFDEATTATLSALESALDAIRERHPATPSWEYCEGVLTALLCTRRAIGQDEWLLALFGRAADEVFASPGERTHFMMHALARETQLRAALQAPVEQLDDDRALAPAVTDWRGMLATLSDEERAEASADGLPPALARDWASGFIFATDFWADDWAPPRDKDIAAAMADALDCVAELIDEDRAAPALNLFDSEAAPSTSQARFEAYGEALWAVYDLHDIARSLGPRVEPIRHADKTGRNDPCPCGSGKKYKKCCGA